MMWLIPVLPLAGFLVLALLGKRLKAGGVAAVACGSVGLSMVTALVLLDQYAMHLGYQALRRED